MFLRSSFAVRIWIQLLANSAICEQFKPLPALSQNSKLFRLLLRRKIDWRQTLLQCRLGSHNKLQLFYLFWISTGILVLSQFLVGQSMKQNDK